MRRTDLTPEHVLTGYCHGVFPMAHPEEGNEIYWYAPDPRAVLPLDRFHTSRNLRKLVRRGVFDVTFDRAFDAVIRCCADRSETWISDEIIAVYGSLHEMGFAHSVEVWLDGRLAGGLYGVAIGGAFFGESMFHHERDASKVALVHLVNHLRGRGFTLLDTQFTTPHLAQFGVVEIPRTLYHTKLTEAINTIAAW